MTCPSCGGRTAKDVCVISVPAWDVKDGRHTRAKKIGAVTYCVECEWAVEGQPKE